MTHNMREGHAEGTAIGAPNDEESVDDRRRHDRILLPLLRMLRICRLRERHSLKPHDWIRLLLTLLAHRLRQRLHHPPPPRRIPGSRKKPTEPCVLQNKPLVYLYLLFTLKQKFCGHNLRFFC